MTAWIVAGCVLVVLLGALVFAMRNRYARVFTDRHLEEFCETLDAVRGAACAAVEPDEDVESEVQTVEATLADPRNAQTDGGMRLNYTVSRDAARPGKLQHHLSMSHENKLPAESFARFFAGLALVRFGIAPREVAAQRSNNLVLHLAWEIAETDTAAFAATREEFPVLEELELLRKRAREAGRALDLQRVRIA